MTQRWKFAFLTLLIGGAAWFAPFAKADEWDKQTIVTFNKPVEVPGSVLRAGTYVFKLAEQSVRSECSPDFHRRSEAAPCNDHGDTRLPCRANR
jgi:hypothetical protein